MFVGIKFDQYVDLIFDQLLTLWRLLNTTQYLFQSKYWSKIITDYTHLCHNTLALPQWWNFENKSQLAVDFCSKNSSRKILFFRFDFPWLSNGLLKTGYYFRKHSVSKIEVIKKCLLTLKVRFRPFLTTCL